MISTATLRYMRISPRKVRPVIALVKGKRADDAISTLYSVKRKASALLIDVINSAVSNAGRIPGMDASNLYISSLVANGGPQLKRFRAASMGRAGSIRKRTSHITVELDAVPAKEAQAPGGAGLAAEAKKVRGAKAPVKTNPKEDRAAKKPKAKEAGKSGHDKKGKE
ncbi:MAG: 50S ribosomal protein L22 [Candidatus Omnitrophota bacterium]